MRKQILSQLTKHYRKNGPDSYILGDTLPEFNKSAEECSNVIMALIREGLIIAIEDPELTTDSSGASGHRVLIAVNPDRLDDITKELSAWYRDPRFLIPVIISLAGLIWVIVAELFKS